MSHWRILAGILLSGMLALPATMVNAQSYQRCRRLNLEIVNPERCPIRVLDGTRVCRAAMSRETPDHLKRAWQDDMPFRAILRNVSDRTVVSMRLRWTSYESDDETGVVEMAIDRGVALVNPLKFRPGKRLTYDFNLSTTDAWHDAGSATVIVVAVEFADGDFWVDTTDLGSDQKPEDPGN